MKELAASTMDKNRKLCARIDLTNSKVVGGVELGEEVTVVVRGKVKALRGPDQHLYDKYGKNGKVVGTEKEVYPGSLEVEISSIQVEGRNELDPGDDYEE